MSILKDFSTGDTENFKEKKPIDRSKIGRGSKKKGKVGEAHIAKLLTKVTGQKWMRIPNSGAFVGKSNRRRLIEMSRGQITAALGDIFPPDNLKYRFVVESKFYKTFAIDKLDSGKVPAKLKEWVEENEYDCISALMIKDTQKHLGLIYIRINNTTPFLVGNIDYIQKELGIKLNLSEQNRIFELEPLEELKSTYGNKWFFDNAEAFVNNNKELFEFIV